MPEPSSSSENGNGPYIPASRSLPEITLKGVLLGALLSAVLAGANAYLGLKVGMTVSASIPAAVLSMAILRFIGRSNILENNIVQTAASAGESLAAGVIFTLPALIMLDYWKGGFEFLPTMAVALLGGILGVLFTIPLRRALILEAKLRFPEGVATAEVLKAGEQTKGDASRGAITIAIASLVGGAVKLCQSGFKLVSGGVHGSVTSGRSIFGFGSELGPALLAVGYIVGLNIAVLVFAGGLISWLFGIPLYMKFTDPDEIARVTRGADGYAAAISIWSKKIRYLGVGAMATGGLWTLAALFKPIRDGIRSSFEAMKTARSAAGKAVLRTDRDMPIHFVLAGTVALAVPILVLFYFVIDREVLQVSTGTFWATVVFGVFFALLAGFLFSSVAGYMAGLVGSSNNPISGVTIATVLVASLILLVLLGSQIDFGVEEEKAIAAAATAILIGGVVCCAAAIAGDNLQDLKAGHLVGATPYKQQIMQIVGVVAAAIVIGPILQLLFTSYGLGDVMPREGMDSNEALKAPQATLMSSVARGVLALKAETSSHSLPWGIVGIGVIIAAALIVVDQILKARSSAFRVPVLAVAVGIYLPLELSVPIFIGGLLAHFAARISPTGAKQGLLLAAGLITGEALMGILLAIPFAAAKSTNVLALPIPESLGWLPQVLGVAVFAGLALWLFRTATRGGATANRR